MEDNNNEKETSLNSLEDTLDVMFFGEPDIKSYRIKESIKRHVSKKINQSR